MYSKASDVPAPDKVSEEQTTQHLDSLTKPPGSLGRLEELAIWAGGVQGQSPPQPFEQTRLVIFAGDHGIATAAGTSAFPSEVTAQMVANFLTGGAAATVLANAAGATVRVVDVAVDSDYQGLGVPEHVWQNRIRRGSGALDREDALTVAEAEASLALGAAIADEEIDSGADLLIAGDMGIGNTTPAAALIAGITGADPVAVCGRGTGIDDETWMRKVSAIRDGLWRAHEWRPDPIVLLQKVGGADLGAISGFVAQAARRGTPVVLDGVVVGAAALLAERMHPGAKRWWLAGHQSAEPAHSVCLEYLDLDPLLRYSMRLGEGSGALLALPMLQGAIATSAEMATFSEAGVSGKSDEQAEDTALPDEGKAASEDNAT